MRKKSVCLRFFAPFSGVAQNGKQCPWIAIRLPALLVEGIPQAPMNAEFHSAAARPLDAFSQAKNSPEYDF